MKVPLRWLRDYVEFDATPEELASRLTFSGTEVESLEKVGSDYAGVVVGEIRAAEPIPNTDGLSLCRVFDGRDEVSVVCGARNFRVGDKAPLARVGAVLPNGTALVEKTLAGVVSRGMLCAEDELGLSDDHSGLMILPAALKPGTPFVEVVGPPDTVLQLEVTWNRPDCLSIVGMAREVAALYRTRLTLPDVSFPETGEPVEALADVEVQDPAGCPRYTARVLTDLSVGSSPLWMQRRLALCGVRPISNVVDITNYVLLECGHPLHAFDYTLLADHRVVVRRARPGETMATLDGVERKNLDGALLIADTRRGVALAGIMGGAGSEINPQTRNVLLESACFDPPDIRRTSSRTGLSTESSFRFERGVDIGGVDWASRRAAALMVELAGATAARGVIDLFPAPPEKRRIPYRFRRADRLLGLTVPPDETAAILESLQLTVEKRDADTCAVSVPTFRRDLEIEADLVEEVARMHGLDQLPDPDPISRIVPDADDAPTQAVIRLRRDLRGLGLSEIMNYSFLSEPFLDLFSTADKAGRVVLPNPVSADYAVMRPSLVPQMVDTLGRNLARQVAAAAFFEIGRVFLKTPAGGIREEDHVCIGLMGKVGRVGLDQRRALEPDEVFLWLKGILESLASALRLGPLAFAPAAPAALAPGWAVSVSAGGKALGVMGIVDDRLRRHWRISEPAAVAELDLAPLLAGLSAPAPLRAVPAYPSVSRDVALIVDESVTHEDVLKIIRDSAPKELTGIELFDIFRAKQMGEGRKSLAYSLEYRSLERTLTDEDANRYHETIKDALKKKLKADIREGR